MSLDGSVVSLVVPAFNEGGILELNLAELLRYTQTLQPAYRFELIVVNDGSSDGTAALADAFAARHPSVTVVHHATNRGLGAALRTGFSRARGDLIVVLDLDLSYAPYHVASLLHALVQNEADIAVASPYLKGGSVRNVPWLRKWMSSWANRFLSIAAGGKLATLTGMVRAYDARSLRMLDISADGMEVNHEIVFAALKKGMRIVEVPANLEWRTPPTALSSAAAAAAGTASIAPARRSSMRMYAHIWSVLTSGFRHRPAMFFALPALIPGLLPLVMLLALLLRPSHAVLLNTTLVTIALQWLSLGFITVMTGSYVYQLRSINRRAPLQDGTQTRA